MSKFKDEIYSFLEKEQHQEPKNNIGLFSGHVDSRAVVTNVLFATKLTYRHQQLYSAHSYKMMHLSIKTEQLIDTHLYSPYDLKELN